MKRLLTAFVLLFGLTSAIASSTQFTPLGNPTQYTFSVSSERVLAVLKENHTWGPLGAGFLDSGQYTMGVYNYYTKRYWSGKREAPGDVNPPEAGQIGTITATFYVDVKAIGPQKTLVVVRGDMFEQQIGRHYAVLPHFHKTGTRVNVKSDTYFEYLFLTLLGEKLGEKGMPPLRGTEG